MKITKAEILKQAPKLTLLLLLVAITFAYTIPWVFSQLTSGKEYIGIDMHAYWYPGLYFRQGVNPYAAILNNPNPSYWDPRRPGSGDPMTPTEGDYSLRLPISFLGGQKISSLPVAQLMIEIPSATAPLGILLWAFSWVSWQVVRVIWAVINIILAIAFPWLVIRLSGNEDRLGVLDQLILAFFSYNIYGLRQGLVVGQQTLLCLILILLSMRLHKHWLPAGILLGIALSKYSVAVPFFVFFFLNRKYRILLTSIAVQVIGLVALMPLKWGSPVDTIGAYLKVLEVHSGQSGIQIASTFPWGIVSNILMGLVVVIALLVLVGKSGSNRLIGTYTSEHLIQLNFLILVVLLTTYHRIYDTSLTIFFFLFLMISIMKAGNTVSLAWRSWTVGVGLVSGALMIYPTLIGRLAGLPEFPKGLTEWLTPEAVTTIALLLMFTFATSISIPGLWKMNPVPKTI